MKILAKIQNMSSAELMSIIPADQYVRIKEDDPNPVFRAYVVGQEGISEGKVVGEGAVVKRWYASAIQKLYEKLKSGLRIFHNHGATNEHDGRVSIGEMVGKALKTIGDKLSVVAVMYIKPMYRSLPLDIASIEADVRLSEDNGITDADVADITGIALGNSAINKPGFAGATLLAQIQAFADQRFQGGKMELTIDEIKEFVKANKVNPSDIFGGENGGSESDSKGALNAIREADRRAYEAKRQLEREGEIFTKKKAEYEDRIAKMEADIRTKDISLLKTKVPSLIESAFKERKMDDRQKKFITSRIDRFTPTAVDKLETELSAHLDQEIAEFNRVGELFGVKAEKGDGKKDESRSKVGAEPEDDTRASGEIANKYLDPRTNPFIPK